MLVGELSCQVDCQVYSCNYSYNLELLPFEHIDFFVLFAGKQSQSGSKMGVRRQN